MLNVCLNDTLKATRQRTSRITGHASAFATLRLTHFINSEKRCIPRIADTLLRAPIFPPLVTMTRTLFLLLTQRQQTYQ